MSDHSLFVITRGERLILLTVGYLFLGATFYQHGKRLLRTLYQAGGAWRQRAIPRGAQPRDQPQQQGVLRQQQAQLRQLQRQRREQLQQQQQPAAAGAAPGIA